MPGFELVRQKDGVNGVGYPVLPEGLVLGRAPDVDVVLVGQMVSRRHAKIWLEGDVPMVEDLGSRNGITVNGRRVVRSAVAVDDQVVIGDAEFVVAEAFEPKSASSIISYETAGALPEQMVAKDGMGALPILYKAAKLLGTVFDLDDLLKQILETIFEALPVQRGFILTLTPGDDEPQIHASLPAETDTSDGPPLSQTLIRHVFERQSAMLTLDAMDDSRFDASQSILRHAIHGAMCAPLIGRQQAIAGAIYVDAGNEQTVFTKDHLELLTAIGGVVGVAVENARLYQENVNRERLAAIGQATAGVGHCVKNILTGIMGGAQFIDMAIEKEDFKYLEKGWPIMSRAIERIEMLVLNMLSFSRDRKPELAPMDINGLVLEVFQTVRPRADKLKVALESERGEIGVVHADGREIYRVLLNLVTNALDVCERTGGTVTVTTHRRSDGFCIAVKDTGPGVSEEIMPRLSQAFVSTKGSSGTGLGLACSFKSVREHGGDIWVESELGKGATFTVFLPEKSPETPTGISLTQTK